MKLIEENLFEALTITDFDKRMFKYLNIANFSLRGNSIYFNGNRYSDHDYDPETSYHHNDLGMGSNYNKNYVGKDFKSKFLKDLIGNEFDLGLNIPNLKYITKQEQTKILNFLKKYNLTIKGYQKDLDNNKTELVINGDGILSNHIPVASITSETTFDEFYNYLQDYFDPSNHISNFKNIVLEIWKLKPTSYKEAKSMYFQFNKEINDVNKKELVNNINGNLIYSGNYYFEIKLNDFIVKVEFKDFSNFIDHYSINQKGKEIYRSDIDLNITIDQFASEIEKLNKVGERVEE
jgi:hypothetical protein